MEAWRRPGIQVSVLARGATLAAMTRAEGLRPTDRAGDDRAPVPVTASLATRQSSLRMAYPDLLIVAVFKPQR